MKDAVAQDTGIVDENVDSAEAIKRRGDDFFGIARIADR